MGNDSVASIDVGRWQAQSARNASKTEVGVRAPNHRVRHADRASPSREELHDEDSGTAAVAASAATVPAAPAVTLTALM
jgi:hypothetical protein